MVFTNGHPKIGGRKRGSRNQRTIAAAARPDALDHLERVMLSKDDPLVTPDMRLRAATTLAAYQHPKPSPSHTEAFVTVDGYEEPKTVDEARALILKLGARLAKGEISVVAHDAIIGGLRAYLGDKAAEQQAKLDELEAALRGDRP